MSDDPCNPAAHAAGHPAHRHLAHHVGRRLRLRPIRARAPSPEAYSCGKHFDASQPGGLASSPVGRAGMSATVHKAALLAGAGAAALASLVSVGVLASVGGLSGGAGQRVTDSLPAGSYTGQGAGTAAGADGAVSPADPASVRLASVPDRRPALPDHGATATASVAGPTPVPEPASAALVAVAALVAILVRHRRRQRTR